MSSHLLRWARMSVAALVILMTVVRAEATKKVTVGPKTTLDGLARKYGVPKPEIARANGIHPEAILRDGQTLIIPDPPPAVKLPPVLNLSAMVKANRVALRRGPGANYYRITLVDHGTPMQVTAQKGDWYQVRCAAAPNAWVRADFIAIKGKTTSSGVRQAATTHTTTAPTVKVAGASKKAARPPVSATAAKTAAASPSRSFVCADNVSLRKGPSPAAARLRLLDRGTRVQVAEAKGEWRRVVLAGGTTGWILGKYVASAAPTQAAKAQPAACTPGPRVIRGDRVVIRKGASRDTERIAMLDDGAQVRLLARQGQWCKVLLASGRRGWVLAQYVGMKSRAGVRPQVVVARSEHREPRRTTRTAARTSGRRSVAAVIQSRRRAHDAGPPAGSADVVRTAFAYRGVRYRYGGSAQGGFDCSGFTRYVYAKKGVELPHRAAEQFQHGQPVPKSQLKPGDLVFFQTTRRGISHVGIYAGNGRFIHASSAKGRVRVDSLESGYYAERFRGARRVRQRSSH